MILFVKELTFKELVEKMINKRIEMLFGLFFVILSFIPKNAMRIYVRFFIGTIFGLLHLYAMKITLKDEIQQIKDLLKKKEEIAK